MKKFRVLVVDDHPLMREALCAAIAAAADMEVVGEASNGQDAVEQVHALHPDVTVMDLLMPGMDGVEAIAAIHTEFPQACILALTSSTEEGKVLAAVQAGALGYLLKDAPREELLQAIREVGRGNEYLPSHVALKLMRSVRRSSALVTAPSGERPIKRLTARQKEVLDLLGLGLSNREIAEKLVVSEVTVRSHIHGILGRLGLESRSQAAVYAASSPKVHRGPEQNERLG